MADSTAYNFSKGNPNEQFYRLYDPTRNVNDGSPETQGYVDTAQPPNPFAPHSQGYTNNFQYPVQSSEFSGVRRVPYRNFSQPRVPLPMPEYDPEDSAVNPGRTLPWDANAVGETTNAETRLIGKFGSAGRPPTRRRSFIVTPFKRYLDPESQSTSQLQRGASFRTIFGMETADEYADEEELDYQIPISGDEYQLNTWGTEGPNTKQVSKYHSENTADYNAEHDLSQGYQDGLQPWLEEDEQNTIEKDLAGEEEYDSYEDSIIHEEEKGLRTVELFHGNLVLDCPVSARLLQQYPEHRPVREFTHMRYTAATCDPEFFIDEHYTLRQMCYNQPRQTEIVICVTIYNEDDILLARTLQGVFNNIRHLCHRNRSKTWGADGWKKVVVCIVADGRNKLNPRAKALMAALGAYQEGFAKNMVNDKTVGAHIYEYTSMVRISSISQKSGVKLTTEKATPVQLIFCMKEKNQKKINSHRWFFQAFSNVLRPNVCVLLDAGTRPGNHSIYHLWKTFERNPRVGGACGEIAAMLGPGCQKLINPLVASQNFEYKMSNILDKPSESMFGFITVLPGAFSAYRFSALQNHPNGSGPLEKYFKGEKLEGKGGIFQANMYLAEDRILCWELVAKRDANWVLTYVKSAKAHTDVPEKLPEMVLQRRRWLNGAFFAQVYSLTHFYNIWTSGHSVWRKLAFHIQFLYQAISLFFSWFSLANFFLIFHILSSALGDPSANFAPGKVLGIVLSWVYAACILTVFILSFGNRPQGTKVLYDLIVIFFSLMMTYMLFCTVYISVKGIQYAICANGGFSAKLLWSNSTFRDLIISLLATYALYFVISMLFMDPWHVFTSMVQYVILSPAYVNVLNVYAFCNTHDISWGTKGDTIQKLDLGIVRTDDAGKLELELPTSTDLVDKYYLDEVDVLSTPPEHGSEPKRSSSDKREDYYALFRSIVVIVWVLMNLALVGVVLSVGGFQNLIGTKSNNYESTAGSSDLTWITPRQKRATSGACQAIVTGGSEISKVYMAVVFWSVAAMAAFRFILSIAYLTKCLFRRV